MLLTPRQPDLGRRLPVRPGDRARAAMALALTDSQFWNPSALGKMAIEVAVFAVIIYIALRFLRETRGSGVVRGLALLLAAAAVVFVVLNRVLQLDRLALLFETIAQSVVIGVIVVFHPEIRRGIVQLGDAPIFGRFFRPDSKVVLRLGQAVEHMSKTRTGALIAIEREASLRDLADTGVKVDAEISAHLLETIFFPRSALHDGGVVLRDDRILAASCLFPLSQNAEIDKRLGTRHRAALGLSEETDAVVVVVSEETGKITLAIGGRLEIDLSRDQLDRRLGEILGVKSAS
jgi:diadenylate cyclase